MFVVIVSVIVGVALLALALFFGQTSMIYHPRPYTTAQLNMLPTGLQALRSGDSVVGFYRAPSDGAQPQQLWLIFGGNADVAVGWDDFAKQHSYVGVGYLLIEYPSFGAHLGKPTPASILSATEQTIALLAKELGMETVELQKRCRALGHSLGAASALQYAALHPVQRLVLISPFTTMKAMAKRTAGWPLCELLTHRFDNQKCLQEIITTGLPPTSVIHGDRDHFIPINMGHDLATMDQRIQMVIISGGDHNDVIELGAVEIRLAMGF